jgi:transcriptional regulator with XRE-family HTH domain
MPPKGWTLDDLAKELGIEKNAVAQLIHVKGIDPIFRGAIYPPDTLDRIREAPMGRPPKTKPEEPAKAAPKPKK